MYHQNTVIRFCSMLVGQGYKFNIFYPDLVDKTKAPTYTIEKDGSNGETCIIRFHAGPPYEDIVSLLSFNFMKDF